MPYKVTPKGGTIEPISRTRTEAMKEMKGLKPGESALGVIGEVKIKPEPTSEELNKEEMATKEKLIALLTKYVEPPMLSELRPNPARDRASFNRKLRKQTLGQLRRFWPTYEIPDELTDDEASELQTKYEDISP